MMPNFDVLGPLINQVHQTLNGFFYLALPVFIALSVVLGFFQQGGPNYVEILRRSLIAAMLLVAFPEVSKLIVELCDGIASRIDSLAGLETFMRMAEEKSRGYSVAKSALLLKFDDLIIAFLSFLSLIFLYFARYLSLALYYYYWILLSALSPILILFFVFPSTAGITKNLYRSLIEVASWKIVWAVQSAMIQGLSLGNIYKTEGSYITLIVLNFVVALGMLFTPLVVKSLIGEGLHATSQTIGPLAVAVMAGMPLKLSTIRERTRSALNFGRNAVSGGNLKSKKRGGDL